MIEAFREFRLVLQNAASLGFGERLGKHQLHRIVAVAAPLLDRLPNLGRATGGDVIQQREFVDNDFVGHGKPRGKLGLAWSCEPASVRTAKL